MLPVTLRALSKHFGSTVAVDAVDLDIPAGSLFFLLGPSGCGKTTLLRMLAGFVTPTGGTIHFGDRDVTALAPNRRHCAMVFQSYALWPHMTVAQNVAFGLRVRKRAPGGSGGIGTSGGAADRERLVTEALAAVQMADYARRKPAELSGGQQQRVALARALVVRPDLLLLDEPLSNLDAKLRLEMRGTIRAICKQAALTAIYVTHDQKEALSMADYLAVLRDGRVVQVGAPAQVYDRPGSRFVADFLGETNFLEAVVAGVDGEVLQLDSLAGRLRAKVFPPGLAPGAHVTCSVRPEAVRLLRDGEVPDRASLNCLVAQRADMVYLGDTAQHRLVVAGKVTIKAFELNPRPEEDAPAAAGLAGPPSVRIAFHPRDVVVLAE
jgi:iron(III) transport system ATP-binding protein